MQLRTLLINRFIHTISPSNQKLVPWRSHQVAILVLPVNLKPSHPTTAVINTPIGDTPKSNFELKEMPASNRLEREALLQLHTERRVMVTTSASGIHTVKLMIFEGTCQLSFSARGVINVVQLQPFHIHSQLFRKINAPGQTYGDRVGHRSSNKRDDCCIHSQSSASNKSLQDFESF